MSIVYERSSSADARSVSTWLAPYVPICVVFLGVLLSVMRRNPTLFFSPRFFCEDLFVFFNENRLFGIGAFFEPYAGYYQFLSRVIAYLAGFAAPQYAPSLYAAMFIVVIIATSFVIYTSPLFHGWGKVLAALAIVASPTGSEIFYGMCYALWVSAPIVAFALCESPRSKRRATVLLSYFISVGLSSSFVVIAAPFVVFKLINERSRYSACLSLVTAFVVAVQLPGILSRARATATTGGIFERLYIAKSVLYSWITGPSYPGSFWAAFLSISILVLLARYLWVNREIVFKPAIYFIAFGAAIVLTACLTLNPIVHSNPFTPGTRYFFFFQLYFLYWR